MPKRSGIYQIKNTLNNKVYVGSAVDIKQRWRIHKHKLNKLKHHSKKLQNSWLKHGENSFEFLVLEYIEDKTRLIEKEQFWIDELKAAGINGYNVCSVAGSTLGVSPSYETRCKISASLTGMKLSEDTKRKISEFHKGNTYSKGIVPSKETRLKLSIALKGRVFSKETRKKISDANKFKPSHNKGKAMSEEQKKKISLAQKGIPKSPEHTRKNSESHKGQKSWNKGLKASEETRIKLSESHKGKKLSPESIAKREATKKKNRLAKKLDNIDYPANTLDAPEAECPQVAASPDRQIGIPLALTVPLCPDIVGAACAPVP